MLHTIACCLFSTVLFSKALVTFATTMPALPDNSAVCSVLSPFCLLSGKRTFQLFSYSFPPSFANLFYLINSELSKSLHEKWYEHHALGGHPIAKRFNSQPLRTKGYGKVR